MRVTSKIATNNFLLEHHRHFTVPWIKTFGRPELHYIPRRRADYYPIPVDADSWFGHYPGVFCHAYVQEVSQFRLKSFWGMYMHCAGRLWYKFATMWWLWVWGFVCFVTFVFAFAYRNQRIQRIRTWN